MLAPGVRLGPYEVVSRLGAGGMGEVWKATDTRLARSVAIKVLPPHSGGDPQAKVRFEREARTISQLNHPHICALYDVGESGDFQYLVMELLDGETLADRLERGALPMPEVLKYGAQIGDALDRAHRSGIVHRDLKPANVMITRAGAKLLDFGVARTHGLNPASEGAPTLQARITEEGTVLGTLQYMAPEQLAGEVADPRTDIFALGTVLYEMATGRRAFEGRSRMSLIAAIAGGEPRPMSELQPLTPAAFEHVVLRCLRKEREERWQSARDVAEELRWIAETGKGSAARSAVRTSRFSAGGKRVIALVAIAVVLAILIVLSKVATNARTPAPQRLMLQIPMGAGQLGSVSVSPDGSRVAYLMMDSNGDYQLVNRSLESGEEKVLHTTADGTSPFWSPDGSAIGFFSAGHLYTMPAQGGTIRRVCRAQHSRGRATWNAHDEILFAVTTPALQRVSAKGGEPVPVTTVDAGSRQSHRDPQFVSDDQFLFWVDDDDAAKRGIHLGSLADPKQKKLVLMPPSERWQWIPGFILVRKDKEVLAWRFDARDGEATAAGAVGSLPFEPAVFRVAANGNIVVRAHPAEERHRVFWYDRAGALTGETGEAGEWRDVAISPEGKRLAVSIGDTALGEGVIFVYDIQRGVRTQIVRSPADVLRPVWTPKGDQLIYTIVQDGVRRFQMKAADGTGEALPLPDPDPTRSTTKLATRISRDSTLSFIAGDDVWVRRLGTGEDTRLTSTEAAEFFAEISPDGQWVAYASDGSGTSEIYVQSVATQQRVQISTNGGYDPKWRGDGRELFYIDRADYLVKVDIDASSGELEAGAPKRLFHTEFRGTNTAYDVSADGQRFVIITGPEPEPRPLLLLANWLTLR